VKTLEELKKAYQEANRTLRAVCEAAAARGETIHVSEEDHARFEEMCAPVRACGGAAPQRQEWVRC
jgi:hypothetical protein